MQYNLFDVVQAMYLWLHIQSLVDVFSVLLSAIRHRMQIYVLLQQGFVM